MLNGDLSPSAGEAHLNGLSMSKHVHECRRNIGFCPQFDALLELLTGREHLELYARIKGIPSDKVSSTVEAKLNEFDLTEFADRLAGTYSGGNKRKLSVALAMMGEPSIIFLGMYEYSVCTFVLKERHVRIHVFAIIFWVEYCDFILFN